ncbi:MAG: Gfo/Idh/MocA family oxidoreductase [Candidatus Omnitrophica bacterium]|nr:Gfo/Idh/MocA family oxidoreductase [Candidatus Omnitrophota bacterium]
MVRVGIVGSRFSAGLHAQAYQRTGKVELVAASAIDNLNEFCRKYRIADSCRDFREMLKRDDIELVSVCVPNFLHKEVVIAAAESGKHVICEKPLATRVEDAREMLRAARKNRVKLMYAEDWIFAPALRRAKSICDEGAIGQVLYLKAKETHPGSHSLYAQKIEYCGGGAMIHLAIHSIGFVRWFKGKEVVEVVGKVSGGARDNLKHHNFEGEDWGVGILTFEDKSQALVEGNYITCGGLDDVVEIYGSKGVIKIDLTQGSPLSVYSLDGYSYAIEKAEMTKGWTKPAVDEEASLGYIDEIAHFVDCVAEDKEPQPGMRGEDGLKALEVTMAIYKSAQEGRTIKIR